LIAVLGKFRLPLGKHISRDFFNRCDTFADVVSTRLTGLIAAVQLFVLDFKVAAVEVSDFLELFKRGLELLLGFFLVFARILDA